MTLSLSDKHFEDLLTVVANLAEAASPEDTMSARRFITGPEDHKADFGEVSLGLRGHEGNIKLCGHRLEIVDGERLLVGGGGVVIPCREAGSRPGPGGVRYALKAARPSLFVKDMQKQAVERKKALDEYETHLPLAHPNIAKMYSQENVNFKVRKPGEEVTHDVFLPCTLIEWVDEARPFDEYVQDEVTNPDVLSELLVQAFRAVEHLHRAKVIHWDIKSDNLLVSGQGQVKLMDLGNARRMREKGDRYGSGDERTVESTLEHYPPELQERAEATAHPLGETDLESDTSSNRAPCHLELDEEVWDRPWLDLHMLGREINRVIGFDPELVESESKYAARLAAIQAWRERTLEDEEGEFVSDCLELLLGRLVVVDRREVRPYYEGAGEVVEALERLSPEYGAGTDMPELQAVPQHVLRLPPCNNVPWTAPIQALMSCDTLLRLKSHRQLATVRHVFAGGEHTRWEHTAGALGRVLQSIRALYADRHSVRFRLDTSKQDIWALMLATLLHDVGHPALGHQLEESPIMVPPRRHEAYAHELLRECLPGKDDRSPQAEQIRNVLTEFWCAEVEFSSLVTRTIELLAGELEDARNADVVQDESRVHLELLHSLVNGPLDADKSDYLTRDAHHCGVEYANGVDRMRLDQTLTAIEIEGGVGGASGRRSMLGVSQKGILPLESMLIARYQLFRSVYWHHTVRALTVMLQELVERYVFPDLGEDESECRTRLDGLQGEFRARADDEAIGWLMGQVEDATYFEPSDKDDLRGLAAGVLGTREKFFRRALMIFGTEEQDEARQNPIYSELQAKWMRGTEDESGFAAVRARRSVRSKLAKELTERFRASGQLTEATSIREADVLLDVPVKGKDQVSDLYVRPEGGGSPQSVDTVTPLAKAVARAFEWSVRPVRVYLHQDVAKSLGTGTRAKREIEPLILDALSTTTVRQQAMPVATSDMRSRG